jgi:disulfide oxidoreductase YuzD
MSKVVSVRIVGAPVACEGGVKDSWRETANWAEGQLKNRFGEAVQVKYFDLFDTDCPPMPANAQLPLVYVEDEVVINGGKISIPIIRHRVEELIEKEVAISRQNVVTDPKA